MFRQSKKIVCLLSSLILVLLCAFIPAKTTNAADIYYSTFNRPTENEYSGFINLEIDFDDGGTDVITMAWTIIPTMEGGTLSGETPAITTMMDIQVNKSSIKMTGVSNTMDEFFMTVWELNKSGKAVLYSNGYGTYEKSITDSWGGTIIGHTVYGNYGSFDSYLGSYAPQCSVVWADDGVQIAKLNDILTSLASLNSMLGGKLNELLSEVESIITEIDDVEESLRYLGDYIGWILQTLDRIELYEKESTSWLEKIFNYLDQSEEKQKETATNQGNSSVSQGNSAIEDKGGDFAGSLSGLTNSMSYTGTMCAWEFPTIKLPAIPGIMDEVVLVESQPIDFSVWVSAIPSGVLLVIQSILTIGLIVYCFKELYSTIAYVLTLRKDDNS